MTGDNSCLEFYEQYYDVAEDHASTTQISYPRWQVHYGLPVGSVLYWADVEAVEGVSRKWCSS